MISQLLVRMGPITWGEEDPLRGCILGSCYLWSEVVELRQVVLFRSAPACGVTAASQKPGPQLRWDGILPLGRTAAHIHAAPAHYRLINRAASRRVFWELALSPPTTQHNTTRSLFVLSLDRCELMRQSHHGVFITQRSARLLNSYLTWESIVRLLILSPIALSSQSRVTLW